MIGLKLSRSALGDRRDLRDAAGRAPMPGLQPSPDNPVLTTCKGDIDRFCSKRPGRPGAYQGVHAVALAGALGTVQRDALPWPEDKSPSILNGTWKIPRVRAAS